MRKTVVCFFFVICCVLFPGHAVFCADVINGDMYGPVISLDRDVIFSDKAFIGAGRIDIDASLNIENHGIINSDINVCPGCELYVRNTGDIHGIIHLNDGASMVQIVRDADEVTPLFVDSTYVIFVDGAHEVNWAALAPAASDAGKIILRDSTVFMGNVPGMANVYTARPPEIELQGNVTILLPQWHDFSAGPVMRNVSGDGTVVVGGADPGPLYAYVANEMDGDLYIDLVRETDYFKILGNDLGRSLNELRLARPDDGLLSRLDAAGSMDELWKILSRSVAARPYLLAKPIKILDGFIRDMSNYVRSIPRMGTDIAPFYIKNRDFDIYGALAGIFFNPGPDIDVGVHFYGASGVSNDSINDFTVDMYGLNLNIRYQGRYFFARGLAGGTRADFSVPYIFDDGHLAGGARGTSYYGLADIGTKIDVFGRMSALPYIGAEYEYADVFDARRGDIALRAGVDAVWSFDGVDLRYDYRLGAATATGDTNRINAGLGICSPADGMAVDALIALQDDGDNVSYLVSMFVAMEF